jgi:hypothetical protein
MRRLDKSAEHALCADLLFEIFKASMTLQGLTAENFPLRNGDVQRAMTSLAKDLNALRRALHCEFTSRASFDAVSPYGL